MARTSRPLWYWWLVSIYWSRILSVDCLSYKVALHYCSLSFTLHVTDYILQPGDDIVFMAQELEKVFMQKIAQMPPEERLVILNKGKRKGKKPEGKACIIS